LILCSRNDLVRSALAVPVCLLAMTGDVT
jgi:hypothetical protein